MNAKGYTQLIDLLLTEVKIGLMAGIYIVK